MARIAHRTSPTNIGLSLLANLAAYDFGYITAGQLADRTSQTFHTMDRLERHRGHFFNWYDTQSLKPLQPLYISTVDSGNLAGHLLTLRPGLLAMIDQTIVSPRLVDGLGDTFITLVDANSGSIPAELAGMQVELEESGQRPPVVAARHPATAGASGQGGHARGQGAASLRDPPVGASPGRAMPGRAGGYRPACRPMGSRASPPFAKSRRCPAMRRRRCMRASGSRPSRRWPSRRPASPQMQYDFLFDRARQLLTIGYNVAEHRADQSYYDLLASEARLCSFVAIAQGQVPQDHWFALGRMLITTGGEPMLLSWSGSMFEYLMPLLVMPTYENTLLDETYRAAVDRQIEYGQQRGVPWGISESGYNAVDAQLNYQYRAFGVPGLGLKRGLADDLVIAPYATVLALMVAPEEACSNLERLAAEGFEGAYGLYEAIDYTPSRVPRGQLYVIVRSFMAHHQGMSLLALAYLLLDRPMQQRFGADPLFQATDLLLAGARAASLATVFPHRRGLRSARPAKEERPRCGSSAIPIRRRPKLHLLSNGRYHVMVTNAGGGYSRWRDLAVTRWREDATCDNWGSFCYLRDAASERVLVDGVSADAQAVGQLRGDLLRGARRIPPPRRRLRYPHRDQRLARRRHRAAAHHHHQHRALAQDHRSDQLRGGGPGPGGGRCAAPGVQQPVRADGAPAQRAGDSLHPPAALRARNVRRGCAT